MIIKDGNKIQRNLGGEVINDAASASSKILDINPAVRQFHNRIDIAEADSQVSRIMDSAQNICFSQSDSAKQPVYNYDGYFEAFPTAEVMVSKEVTIDYSKGFTFGTWINVPNPSANYHFLTQRITGTYIFLIAALANSLLMKLQTPDGLLSVTFPYSTANQWFHFGGQYNPITGVSSLYVDGVLKNRLNSTISFASITAPLWFTGFDGSVRSGFLIENFELHDKPLYIDGTIEDQIFTPKTPAIWYKKYQNKSGNKKLFLSSRYTDGAVINAASEITSINYELKGQWGGNLVQPTGSRQPKISHKNGFDFSGNSTASLYSDNGTEENKAETVFKYDISNNMFIGWWAHRKSFGSYTHDFYITTAGSSIFLRVRNVAATQKIEFNFNLAGVTLTTVNDMPLAEWTYLAACIYNGTAYIFMGGVLIASSSITQSGIQELLLTLGTTTSFVNGIDGYIDDFYWAIEDEVPINPTGYSIGDKVFQPDLRKSLSVKESTAQIQYIEDN